MTSGGLVVAFRAEAMPLERTQDSMLGDVSRIILAVILPPLGVFFEVGLGQHFWINIILTLPGLVPRVFHAVLLLLHDKTNKWIHMTAAIP